MNDATTSLLDTRTATFAVPDTLIDTSAPRLGAMGIAVYVTLCRYARDHEHLPPNIWIARTLGLSDAEVRSTLQVLDHEGWIDCGQGVLR